MGEEIVEEVPSRDERISPKDLEPTKKQAVKAIILLNQVFVKPLGGLLKERGIKIRRIEGPCIVFVQYGEGKDQGKWTLPGRDREWGEEGLEPEMVTLGRETEEETSWQLSEETIGEAKKLEGSHVYEADDRGPEAEVDFYLIENPTDRIPRNLITAGDPDQELAKAAVFPLAHLFAVLEYHGVSFAGSDKFEPIYKEIANLQNPRFSEHFIWEKPLPESDETRLIARDVSLTREMWLEQMKPSLVTALKLLAEERPELLKESLSITNLAPGPGKS